MSGHGLRAAAAAVGEPASALRGAAAMVRATCSGAFLCSADLSVQSLPREVMPSVVLILLLPNSSSGVPGSVPNWSSNSTGKENRVLEIIPGGDYMIFR
eukprot:14755717-Heterocapsa_arctica.AAC.1